MKIAFIGSPRLGARALEQLRGRYGQADLSEADYIVAVGSDGTVLRALRAGLSAHSKPIFAMRGEGSLGYLCNRYAADGLHHRLVAARRIVLRPLEARIEVSGKLEEPVISFNEIVLMRQRLQAAKLKVASNVREVWPTLVGDGLLITTHSGVAATIAHNAVRICRSNPGCSLLRGSPCITLPTGPTS